MEIYGYKTHSFTASGCDFVRFKSHLAQKDSDFDGINDKAEVRGIHNFDNAPTNLLKKNSDNQGGVDSR